MQKWKLGVGVAVVAVVAIAAVVGFQRGEPAKAAAGPGAFAMPVPVAKIERKTIPIYLEYAARTEAIRNIALQAKIAGYVLKQHVADGADVKEGDLLYTIDPRDYQAALDSAKAQLQRDMAALDYAKGNVERGTTLASNGYLDKNTFEQRTSTLRQSEAGITIAQAAVRSAEINLGYTEIRAPFSGRLGRNQASVGTLLTAGSATLNTLVQLDPIYVTFNPSETDLAALEQARAKGKVAAEVYLPGEGKARYAGEVTFIDNTVDRSTGTIVARATIAKRRPFAVARPVCAHQTCRQRAARCAGRVADSARLKPAWQISLRRRQGQQGRDAPGLAGPDRRQPRRHRQRHCRRRPRHQRQPAEDRSGSLVQPLPPQ